MHAYYIADDLANVGAADWDNFDRWRYEPERSDPVPVPLDIITCAEWGARQPTREIQSCAKAVRLILHHTAGHHREIALPGDESREEALRYARDIQAYHMSPSKTDSSKPWIDSGHNFLVCRNGLVLQGRWGTVTAIEKRKMVVSAHCPGQNGQVGVEHEHKGDEPMTDLQRAASAALLAWVSAHYGRSTPLPLEPHSKYFATACPANLASEIPLIHELAESLLGQL